MIIADRSEISGCEVTERMKYRETSRSGKAPSEARDWAQDFLSSFGMLTVQRYKAPASRELVAWGYRDEVKLRANRLRTEHAVRTNACNFGATPPRSAYMFIREGPVI